jgi:hypothetical protein
VAVFNPIKSTRKLRRFGVLDLEWVPGETLPTLVNTLVKVEGIRTPVKIPLPVSKRMTSALKLRLAGYYDQQARGSDDEDEVVMEECYRRFNSIREQVDFLLTRERRGDWFFAHAGGLADMQFVLDELLSEIKEQLRSGGTRSSTSYAPDGSKTSEEESGVTAGGRCWKIKASFSGSSAIIVHVINGKNAWHFVDSYWLLRDSLANIGKAIGLKKGDDPRALAWMTERFGRPIKDFEELSPDERKVFYRDVPIEILELYNKLDCEILWKAISQFETEIVSLGGQLQQTIASTAMTLFRRTFLQRDIFTSESLNQISQEAYFASRVEVFNRNPPDDFLIYDINSSFPYAMTFPLPGNLVEYRLTLPSDESDDCIYLADATVEVPDMYLPPLPYRKDNRVFFPVGKWRSWFTSTDIRLALREGAVLHKVHQVYVFESFRDFKSYADKIYELRRVATTDFRKLVLKYLLNSLYGKCSESTHKQEMLINPDKIDRETMQMLQPGVWLAEKEAKISHRHVIIAAVITAIARRTLYDLAKECMRQEKPPFYSDSVTGDRTVVLRSPEGRIVVDPIEMVWAKRGRDVSSYRGEKETCVLGEGWTALAKDGGGREGWFPLKRIIRHKTRKTAYLISSKKGQVHVTADHSLVVGGREVKPVDFIEREMEFETVAAPPPVPAEEIDVLEHVKGFERTIHTTARRGGKIEHRLVAEGDDWIRYTGSYEPPQLFKRHYERGSADFHRLLRVLAAFIAEGSSSLRGLTNKSRDCFSLSQNKEKWLLDLRGDLRGITKNVVFTGPLWSEGSNVYYLRSGAGLLACLFGELGGIYGSRGRKLPSFLYELDDRDFKVFWDKMVEGDGSIDHCGDREIYTTNSQHLAAGMSFLMSQHGLAHSILYRPDKDAYALREHPVGSERPGRVTKVYTHVTDDYVYDLEVEGAHTFVDGLGRVLLHNTDSLSTKADLKTGDKLGALKLEKKMEWAEFVAPKIYRGEGFELQKDGTFKPKRLTKAKGFSLGRGQEAWDKLDKIIAGDRIGVQRMTRMRELYRTMVDGQYTTAPFEMLVIKALTFEMLSKRFHYPDGETRPWSVDELRSGDRLPSGFDFEAEIRESFDTVTRSMLAAAV